MIVGLPVAQSLKLIAAKIASKDKGPDGIIYFTKCSIAHKDSLAGVSPSEGSSVYVLAVNVETRLAIVHLFAGDAFQPIHYVVQILRIINGTGKVGTVLAPTSVEQTLRAVKTIRSHASNGPPKGRIQFDLVSS
jgi:hypothetical protein